MNTACVVFLIDESPSMQMRIAEGMYSKIESIATAVNSAIRQMESRTPIDVAVIGYHRNVDGLSVIGSRWGGTFAGKTWVSSDELISKPLRVEVRTKHIVNPVTHSVTPMTVDFPVWFEPQLGPGKLELSQVFTYLAEILQNWTDSTEPAVPPLIFSFIRDLQPGESIANAVIPLSQVSTSQGFPLLLQFHAGTYANVPVIKYPSVPHVLPYGPVQELFYACSPLTESIYTSLRQNQEFPAPGAKGLVYNGRMVDMVRMLGFLKVNQATRPVFAQQSPPTETVSPASVPLSGTPFPPNSFSRPQFASETIVPDNMALPPVKNPIVPPANMVPSQQNTVQSPVLHFQEAVSESQSVVKSQQSSSFSKNIHFPEKNFLPPSAPTQSLEQEVKRTPLHMACLSPDTNFHKNSFQKEVASPNEDLQNPEFQQATVPEPEEEPKLVIQAIPPRVPREQDPDRRRIQMPDLISKNNVPNPVFDDFDSEGDEDDSLADIPSVENLPEVKAEIIPDGFEFVCKPLAENKPPREPATLLPRQTLLVLLVDRSVSSLTYKPALEIWKRRFDKTRFMLGELARRGRGRYDVALVFYGKEPDGSTSVVSETLGKTFLADSCLPEAAGKLELMMIQIPNGIGGLISLPRKKLGFTECSPTYPADPRIGFQRVVEIIKEWEQTREKKVLQPVVLHITAGQFQTENLDEALAQFSGPDLPEIQFQQWVFTERPHPSVCCPSDSSFTTDSMLQELWERTDALPGREFLAGVRPGVHEESRGLMVNMDFDVLFEVLDTLAAKKNKL